MIGAAIAILAGLVGLVALYMRLPQFRTVTVSAARFLLDLPEPVTTRWRWSPSMPLRSVSFWLQLGVMALLVAAILLEAWRVTGISQTRLGVWLLVDSSYSMATRQGTGNRMDLARAAVEDAIRRAQAQAGKDAPCFRLSTFNQQRTDHLDDGTADGALALLKGLTPQPVGTNLALPLAALRLPASGGCAVSHLVVVTDRPAPSVPVGTDRALVWIDIAQPVANVGISAVDIQRDPFSGAVQEVAVSITATGTPPDDVRMTVTGPDGSNLLERRAEWSPYGPWRIVFEPAKSGTYRFALSPSGAYDGDDLAELVVDAGGQPRVDWRLADRSLPTRLGWALGTVNPTLKVVNDPALAGPEPTLVVGPGYHRSPASTVALFADRHPILAGVNFDVLDQAGMAAARLPQGFTPIAADTAHHVWIAARETPRAAYIPGLPLAGDGPVEKASMLLFFNSVRWLMSDGVTSAPARWLTPAGTAIDAATAEGEVGGEPVSAGSLDDLVPRAATDGGIPVWPWLVAAAALLFAFERAYAARYWRVA
jgi:hypothetical protein